MTERRLVFTSAGDKHRLHQTVRQGAGFDLLTYFYGNDASARDALAARGGKVVDRKDGKFGNLLAAHQADPALLSGYEAIFVTDDDLALTATQIGRLFDRRQEHDLWIVQPSFERRGRVSFGYSVTSPLARLRYINFVEVNAPLFRADKLLEFLSVYDGSLAGWGIDHWYMNVLGLDEDRRYAICDEVACFNPHGRGNRPREIERLGSQSERREAWERLAADRGLVTVIPKATESLPRSRLGSVMAIGRVAGLWLFGFFSEPEMRRRVFRKPRRFLSRIKRRMLAFRGGAG